MVLNPSWFCKCIIYCTNKSRRAGWEDKKQPVGPETFSRQDGMEGEPGIAPRCSEILLKWEWGEIVQEQQGKAQLKLLVLNQALMLHGQSLAG